ncbi:MAG: class I SAM-dependent methyltransferase [Desulfobaccales bacterium]
MSSAVGYSQPCEICGALAWQPVYAGPVRHGGFGQLTPEPHGIFQCGGCGAQRIEERACHDDAFYKGPEYRCFLGQPTDTQGVLEAHDAAQIHKLQALWPHSLRNRTIADIGCAAGNFLDLIKGLPRHCLAIDLCREFHPSLKERGYLVYRTVGESLAEWAGRVDYVFSFSTIEHVLNPREFLVELKELLKPEGLMLVSTPNLRDAMMELAGPDYQRFFYRTQHRWYFDVDSFSRLAQLCGLEVVQVRCLHRFGISNALAWLRDRRPTGEKNWPLFDDRLINEFWKSYLESKGVGDYLYLFLRIAP